MAKKSTTKKSGERKAAEPSVPSLSVEDFVARVRSALEPLANQPRASFGPALAAASVPAPWLLRSSQHLRARQLIRWFAEKFLTPNDQLSSYFASDLTSQKMTSLGQSLSMPSLFSPREVIVVYDASSLKVASVRALGEALGRTPSSALLILVLDAAKKGSLGDLAQHGTTILLEEFTDAQLGRWIEKEALKNGVGIEGDATRLLAQQHAKNLSLLASEISKLALLCRTGEKITVALVRENTQAEFQEESFRLLQQIVRGDSFHAALVAKRLIENGFHPLQLSAFLARCFRVLGAAKDNPDRSAIHSDLSNYYFVRNLSGLVSGVTSERVTQYLRAVGDMDWKLKSSPFDEQLIVEQAMIRMARLGQGTDQRPRREAHA
ncbi:MAG: DNA polymerase III subunit delta [Deltaproteobacteria bacterium]|nr:DNA polymerase III subunit delta [Deltaproteobacteria bacterium]